MCAYCLGSVSLLLLGGDSPSLGKDCRRRESETGAKKKRKQGRRKGRTYIGQFGMDSKMARMNMVHAVVSFRVLASTVSPFLIFAGST